LQLLFDYARKQEYKRVVVAFQDSEAFDGEVLADLLPLLYSWLGRIPFVLLFGIATSVEMFHEKLPRNAIQCMRGEEFEVERAEATLQRVFDKTIDGSDPVLRLGGALSRFLLQRQRYHIQSVQAFISTLKVSRVCPYFKIRC
jgi:origin recognition complex subunit 3